MNTVAGRATKRANARRRNRIGIDPTQGVPMEKGDRAPTTSKAQGEPEWAFMMKHKANSMVSSTSKPNEM